MQRVISFSGAQGASANALTFDAIVVACIAETSVDKVPDITIVMPLDNVFLHFKSDNLVLTDATRLPNICNGCWSGCGGRRTPCGFLACW